MKVDRRKLDLQLAKHVTTLTELKGQLAPATLAKIGKYEVSPKTVGRLARALNCEVEDLVEMEESK